MATVLLEDGTILKGKSFGAQGVKIGEIIFNTSSTGYQEIITDPSCKGQIITMTYPEIGNYGLNDEDYESKKPECFGLIVKNYCKEESHYKSTKKLGDYLKENDIIAIEDIDTRSLVKKIREKGTMKCLITSEDLKEENLSKEFAKIAMHKINIDDYKNTKEKQILGENNEKNIAFIDFGTTNSVIQKLINKNCKLTVFGSNFKADEILNENFDCVFMSNGAGNPEYYEKEVEEIKNLVGKLPLFGIGLGCNLLALALGAKIEKLKYGHHGASYPVIDLKTNKIFATTQNHNYAIYENSLTGLMEASYRNLNDNTIEGFNSERLKIYAVQFTPDTSETTTDTSLIFDKWIELIKGENK
ncbi:MAG: glutamine-hydrolyzing carbamoyl-phosphate synthase small subunit [Cyanobacteria bacterium SIG30]|nr:glutamine-hydrolyzing carbamoyl-phosphate synthase small subunit [Cyanobacteria bacterium SIG30]